jgi:retron-type reverse transcriptase
MKEQLSIDFWAEVQEKDFSAGGSVTLEEMFEAYYECRKHKRNTVNALKFEQNYEKELVRLMNEINERTYRIGQSIAFIVDKPVKREIFAAHFRDRIIHHLVIKKLNPLFEKEFIYDSYNCRKGRGTLFGIRRLERFIRSCSDNYRNNAYVLKLDIKGFFMSINRKMLFDKLEKFIRSKYTKPDVELLIWIVREIITNDCTKDCRIKSPTSKWEGLPKDKSLFNHDGLGLPIGNLTSQIFANFYLSDFDHFMKHNMKLKYYGRYVDDFFIVHSDKPFLIELISVVRHYLSDKLGLVLHPEKQHLQHIRHGVRFVGAYLLPERIYIDHRTKGYFFNAINKWNKRIRELDRPIKLSTHECDRVQASTNSYYGFMRQHNTYRLRKRMFRLFSARFDKYFSPANAYTKLRLNSQLRTNE